MAKFKLPPISPLLGSNIKTFFNTLSFGKVEPEYYFKVILSFLVVLIGTPFRRFDSWYYQNKIKKQKDIKAPVFIIGHWRSGTTFLHNLMLQDKQFGFVTTYQSVFPNNLIAKFVFRIFMKAHIPDKRPGDNVKLAVNLPQEDEFALSNMNPYTYYQFMYFPREYAGFYKRFIRFDQEKEIEKQWMKDYDRMIRQALFNTGGRVAVLKNPCNTGRIQTLLKLYPNARFIHIVRNPVTVFLSSRKFFTELLPTLWFHKVDRGFIEKMVFEVYEWIMKDFQETYPMIPSENLIEFTFEDFENDPMKYMERIYRQFDLENFEQAISGLEAYITKTAGYKKNKYEEISGNLLHEILERWGFAMSLWNYKVPKNLDIIKKEAVDMKS